MVCGHIHVTDGQNKQTCRFTSYFEFCTLFQKLVQKVVKKWSLNMKVYYTIPLNNRLTGHPENFKIKLYYFQERLSLRYKIILKLLSVSYNYKLNDVYLYDKIKMSRRNAWCMLNFGGRRRVPEKCSLKIDVSNFWKYKEI